MAIFKTQILFLFPPGKDWSLDSDYGSAPADVGAAYLVMLAIDCLLGVVTATERLTDSAVDGEGSLPQTPQTPKDRPPVLPEECTALVRAIWRTVLGALSQLLARTSSEALILQLLKVVFF